MEAPTIDLKVAKRLTKDGRPARRNMDFWCQFNCWYRTLWEAEGRRPTVLEVRRWYDEAADSCWGSMKPTWEETRTHSKCLRSLDQVRNYFRQYRAAKREASKCDAARPAVTGPLQQNLDVTNVSRHQDSGDVAVFREARLRRPLAKVDSVTGFTQSYVVTSTRTISTGAVPKAFGQASLNTTNAARAGVRLVNSDTGVGPHPSSPAYVATLECASAMPTSVSVPGTSGVWLQRPPDVPPTSSQQQSGALWQQQQQQLPRQPRLVLPSITPSICHQNPYCPPVLEASAGGDSALPSFMPNMLLSGTTNTLGTSSQRMDGPARQTTLPGPQPHQLPVPSSERLSTAALLPRDHFPTAHQQAGVRELAGSSQGAMVAHTVSVVALGTATTAEAQQQSGTISLQTPENPYVMAGASPKQRQQQHMAAAGPVSAVGLPAYQHIHHHPAHHPMMHMGYDPMYSHPAYMDIYGYSYSVHDLNVSYWRMYPYCCASGPHPSHGLYSEPPLHLHGYRDSCYGSVSAQAIPQGSQQGTAELSQAQAQPAAVKVTNACLAPVPHRAGASQHGVDTSDTSFELARCGSVPLPQPDARTSGSVDAPGASDDAAIRSSGTASAPPQQPVSPFAVNNPLRTLGGGNLQLSSPFTVQGDLQPGMALSLSPAAVFITPRTPTLLSELDVLFTDGVCDCSL